MEVFKTHNEATALIAKRLTFPRWQDRANDMLRHVCKRPASDGSTAIADHRVKVERVAKGWPASGSIIVKRDDGKRFRLYMTRRDGFKIGEKTQ